jgi:hypothetical protein
VTQGAEPRIALKTARAWGAVELFWHDFAVISRHAGLSRLLGGGCEEEPIVSIAARKRAGVCQIVNPVTKGLFPHGPALPESCVRHSTISRAYPATPPESTPLDKVRPALQVALQREGLQGVSFLDQVVHLPPSREPSKTYIGERG